MARSTKSDPLRNFKFRVTIAPSAGLGQAVGGTSLISGLGFAVVSGLSVQNELIAYREGGNNTHPLKLIGQSDFAPVTFSKGVYANEAQLYKWQSFMHSWSQGAGSQTVGAGTSTSGNNDYRADITVVVYDHPVSAGGFDTPGQLKNNNFSAGVPKLGYKLFNCWPASYSMTDLNAGDSSILIQQLVVNHEGFHILFSNSVDGSINEGQLNSLR